MKAKLGSQRVASNDGISSFPVFAAPSLGTLLLFAAAAYVVIAWPLAFGGFGASVASGTTDVREVETLSQSNVANQLIWILLAAAAAFIVITRMLRGAMPVMTAALFFLCAYLLLALLSMGWALAPDISLRRALQQILIVFIFVGLGMFVREKVSALNAMFLVLAIAILLNTVLAPIIPVGPLGYAGIYAQKNQLGAVAALSLLFSFLYLLSSHGSYKLFTMLIALLSGVLLVVSQSKTSLGLAIICPALAAAIIILSRMWHTTFLVAFALIAAVMVVVFFAVAEVFQLSGEHISLLLFNDTTFTGRTYIWTYVLNFADQRPWLGWGYQSFWSIGPEAPNLKADSFISGLNQSHDGYVDILLETGRVGFLIIIGFLLGLIRAIDRSWGGRPDVAMILLSLTLFCAAHNLLESSLTRGFAVPWIMLLLVAGLASPARDPAARAPA